MRQILLFAALAAVLALLSGCALSKDKKPVDTAEDIPARRRIIRSAPRKPMR